MEANSSKGSSNYLNVFSLCLHLCSVGWFGYKLPLLHVTWRSFWSKDDAFVGASLLLFSLSCSLSHPFVDHVCFLRNNLLLLLLFLEDVLVTDMLSRCHDEFVLFDRTLRLLTSDTTLLREFLCRFDKWCAYLLFRFRSKSIKIKIEGLFWE